jgi:hypothetical protein
LSRGKLESAPFVDMSLGSREHLKLHPLINSLRMPPRRKVIPRAATLRCACECAHSRDGAAPTHSAAHGTDKAHEYLRLSQKFARRACYFRRCGAGRMTVPKRHKCDITHSRSVTRQLKPSHSPCAHLPTLPLARGPYLQPFSGVTPQTEKGGRVAPNLSLHRPTRRRAC